MHINISQYTKPYIFYANMPKTKIHGNDGSLLFPQFIKKNNKKRLERNPNLLCI